MITTSTEFGELALKGAKWHTKIIGIQDEVSNINYSNIVNPYDVFTIGNTASAMLSFDIVEPTQNIENLEIQAQQGIETSKGMEYITLGHFKVLKAVLDGNKLICQAVDKMTYLMSDKYIPNVTLPTTDIAILDDIASQVGVTVVKDNLVSHKITYLTNAYSKKEIIGYIAALQGKNAYFDTQGRLAFKFYDSIDYTIDDDRIYYDTPTNINSESDFTCQYINCTVYANGTVTELTSGNGEMGISITNPFMTQAILDEVLSKVKNLTFRPIEIEFLGDFRLEIGDIVTVNTNGIDYTVPIMQINHMSDGGVITNITSIAQTEAENSVEIEGELSQKLNKMLFDLVETREITDGNTTKIVEQGTQIEAVQGSITSKVWQEDIELAKVSNSVSSQSPIVVNDSANGNYIGMKIYGRSTQNGTPTPENPIEIESVGYENLLESSGKTVQKVDIVSRNRNLINSYRTSTALGIYNTVLYIDAPLKPSTTYTLSFNSNISFSIYASEHVFVNTLYGRVINVGRNVITLTTKDIISKDDTSQWLSPYGWYILKLAGNITTAFNPTDVQWEEGDTATDYVAPQTSTLTITTENGLNSIGDVKDEIDLNRGVIIQRTYKKVFDGTESFVVGNTGISGTPTNYISHHDENIKYGISDTVLTNSLCNRLVERTASYLWLKGDEGFSLSNPTSQGAQIRMRIDGVTNVAEAQAKLAEWYAQGNPLTIITERETPLEIPLSEEEMAQYRALLTYNPTTVINVTDNPQVDIEYYRNSEDGQALANGNSTSSSQIQQLANKISLVVKSGDSETELELTPEMAKVVADIISLNGDVKVNGNQIVDGSITANKINTDGLTVKNSGVDDSGYTRIVDISNGEIVLTLGTVSLLINARAINGENTDCTLGNLIVNEKIKCTDLYADDVIFDYSLKVNGDLTIDNGEIDEFEVSEMVGTADFITTNLVPADEQIARISSGGYYQVGKRVFVQMTLSPTANLASNNYHELFTGFPKPLTGCAALSACLMDEPARLDAYIDRGNTTLVLNTSATLTQGLTIGITGSYICE